LNVALTGGIACGKSTVAQMFVKRGCKLVDADRIAREVVMPGQATLQSIVDTFGAQILLPDGTLDRKQLGKLIFQDEAARKSLGAIIHPAIRAELHRQVEHWNELEPSALIIVDIPLLFESLDTHPYSFDEIIVVYVPRSMQLSRLMAREQLTLADAERRIDAQMSIEQKKARADVVIDNQGTLAETLVQVETYLKQKGIC
jgi:dephospho-CoA kinase